MRALGIVAVCVIAVACDKPTPPPAEVSTPPATSPEAAPPALATPASPTVVPPKLGRDHKSVVACTTDADCGWDNPCLPDRCVEAGEPAVCDESKEPEGTCSCLAGACTMKPFQPPAPSGACEIRGCMVDRAAGTCVADTGGVAEAIRFTPGVDVGPSCDCITPDKGCTFSWFDAVPCKTDRDCWVSPDPRRHPIARPKALRKREFKPCADGEVAPKCSDAGQCVLGPAFTC